jgi:hypothetical protein
MVACACLSPTTIGRVSGTIALVLGAALAQAGCGDDDAPVPPPGSGGRGAIAGGAGRGAGIAGTGLHGGDAGEAGAAASGGTSGTSTGGSGGKGGAGGGSGTSASGGEGGSTRGGAGGTETGGGAGTSGQGGIAGDAAGGSAPAGASGDGGQAGEAGSEPCSGSGCVGNPECEGGDGWSAQTGKCVKCSTALPCAAEGETGRLLATTESQNGSCICETKGGYYPGSEGNVAEKCDADGDGWVNEKAQPAVESSNLVIRENAKCAVRYVPGFRLVSEQGQSFESKTLEDMTDAFPGDDSLGVPAGLPLYESSKNDGVTGTRPTYGDGVNGRSLYAAEVNSLTKACLSELGDTNDNGATDVEEQPGSTLARTFANPKLKSYYARYTEYGYYLELFDGWYDAEAGEYVIAERPRQAYGVPVRYPDGASDYVLECTRHPDVLYTWSGTTLTAQSSVGSDFIRFGEAPGIGHPSQYKCVHVVSTLAYDGATETNNPELVTVEDGTGLLVQQHTGGASKHAWTTNSCYATEQRAPGFPENPEYPVIHCTVDADPPPPGSVRWAAVGYEGYANDQPFVSVADPGGYHRGCANECSEGSESWSECYECEPGDDGARRIVPKGAGETCSGDGVCDGSGTCGDCVPGARQCTSSTKQQICTPSRTWEDNVDCPFQCNGANGTCYSQCAPGTRQCAADLPQHCESDGTWLSEAACAAGRECVGAGDCLKSNGQACSAASDCATNACNAFNVDGDGDGYGSVTTAKFCGSSPPAGHVANSQDCCDTDANAKPGQTSYFTTPRTGCGGYDYNCVSGEEPADPQNWDYNCQSGWSWYSAIPGCGASGDYLHWTNCSSSWSFSWSVRTQACH